MVMSRSEWDALNAMLPPEDQMSYEDYIMYASADETGMTGDQLVAQGDQYAADATSSEQLADSFVNLGSNCDDCRYTIQADSTCSSGERYFLTCYDVWTGALCDGPLPQNCVGGTTTPPPTTPPPTTIPPTTPPPTTIPPTRPPITPPPTRPPITPPPTFYPPPPPPVASPPIAPPPVAPPPVAPIPLPKVKSATPDLIQFNDDRVPEDIIIDLLFEDIGGQELLTIARNDTVNGQSVLYQPIKNLDLLQQEYNPNNLVKLQDTSDVIFANFPIRLEEKLPNQGSGANATNMYIDNFGSLVIEFIGLNPDEQIEVQIAFNGTIYEVNLDDN